MPSIESDPTIHPNAEKESSLSQNAKLRLLSFKVVQRQKDKSLSRNGKNNVYLNSMEFIGAQHGLGRDEKGRNSRALNLSHEEIVKQQSMVGLSVGTAATSNSQLLYSKKAHYMTSAAFLTKQSQKTNASGSNLPTCMATIQRNTRGVYGMTETSQDNSKSLQNFSRSQSKTKHVSIVKASSKNSLTGTGNKIPIQSNRYPNFSVSKQRTQQAKVFKMVSEADSSDMVNFYGSHSNIKLKSSNKSIEVKAGKQKTI